MLFFAGFAPRSPEIEQPDLALHFVRRKGFLLIIELRKQKIRRRLPYQWRRQFTRVERQPDSKKPDHDHEDSERDKKPVHETGCTPKNNSAMSNGVLTFIRILFANLETLNVRRLFLNWWCRCFQRPHLLLHCLQLLLQHGDLRV